MHQCVKAISQPTGMSQTSVRLKYLLEIVVDAADSCDEKYFCASFLLAIFF